MKFLALMLPLSLLPAAAAAAEKAGDVFVTNKVWTIHLKFSAAQWAAIEPKGGPPGMGRPGPGGPGGPGGFGPAMFAAPVFLKGDQNNDGKLSRAEFDALGQAWFAQWDKSKSGRVTREQLMQGLNQTFEMPGMGGPGGRGPGMNLQAPKGKKNGLSGAMGVEFEYVHATLEFDGKTFPDVAVRYKGNGTYMMSRGQLKRSFKIDLNRYTKGQDLAGLTTLNLHSNVTDPSWMNEVLSHRLYRDAKVPAPRTSYARVYVTVEGKHDRQYFGLYSIVEDIDSHFVADRYRQKEKEKEGALFKPVTRTLFEDLGSDWEEYEQPYDAKGKITAAQKQRVLDLAKLVSHAPDEEFARRIGDFLDLDNFSRYMATTVWLSTLDSLLGMGQNFYVYLNAKTNKFEFLPWDLDHSFGQFGMAGSQEQREQLSVNHPWNGPNRFLERVYATEGFRKLYTARLKEFNTSIFAPARVSKFVDEIAPVIRPAIAEESAEKLARFDKVAAGEAVEGMGPMGPGGPGGGPGGPGGGPRGGRGPGGPGPGSFGRTKPIKAFVGPRSESVADQLAGKSEGLKQGGRGPGGPGGPGGGPPGGFGPGMFLGGALLNRFDKDKDGALTREEFVEGFGRWFDAWNTDHSGQLTGDQLRQGINKDLMPMPGGGPGGPIMIPLGE